ncbi:polyadenylate-binding protein [Entamoeba histolytica HM-3:IMSS]|uniref:Polyadenylate-binding protein, putative n=3 Tax=Entamoeba histolytica TaxID=5759 RepID=S0AYB2_ENTHI|nr:polyadenylate-binding protein, putative [Entamoeba histolytica KU27]EMS13251.1 polyadenylate-binding protein [Entamoeba histolytica HM-3:IMSS]BAN39889.1 polyadenylate-binding protein, putative [Entamoeba histolytica]BAN40129.1 polyadenylate-binding protein, putative [Entamoeba histolytica]
MTTAQSNFSDFAENKTIFVSGLSLNVTESVLYGTVLKEFPNQVLNVHINKDNSHDTSIAYINMNTHDSAAQAISKLNGTIIEGRKVNMFWSLRDYKLRTQSETNLYVKGIKKEIGQQKMQEVFDKYGNTLSVKLSTNEKNESNGFGYVKYCTVDECKKVIAAKEEISKEIGEASFDIVKFEKQNKSLKTNIYIGNIDATVTEEQFLKYFETFGPIRKDASGKLAYKIVLDQAHQKNKGFVNYENVEDAQKAISSPKTGVLGSGEILIDYYKSKEERKKEWRNALFEIKNNVAGRYKDFNLYINTGKNHTTSDAEIREKLGSCGEIYSLQVKYYNKQPTEVAYCCFKDAQGAQNALAKASELGWTINKFMTKQEKFISQNMYAQTAYPINFLNFFQMFNPNVIVPQHPQNQNKEKDHRKKSTREESRKPKPIAEKQPKVEKAPIINEDMKNELGDQLYDYILSLGLYDEDLTGRITGVLLESIEYADLKKKIDTKSPELTVIIKEIVENLKKIQN